MQARMVPQNKLPWQVGEWQKHLSQANLSIEQLYIKAGVAMHDEQGIKKANELFRSRAPSGFLERADLGDLSDPLLRQVLPDPAELIEHQGFVSDPLGEKQSRSLPGLLHKYQGRVLVVMTSACAIHCRYCFRRHFPYKENRLSAAHWQQVVDYIANDASITEVIFSGGDPLSLKTETLRARVEPLLSIAHVRRLRFHTRLPVVIPQRIDAEWVNWMSELLSESKHQVVMVVHANHSQELGSEFGLAMQALKALGVTLLNQSVLLSGVNDDADVLSELSQRLLAYGVMPYYLHLLDRVSGVAHFEVPQQKVERIYRELLSTLPGYLVPKLVREVMGAPSKTPVHGAL